MWSEGEGPHHHQSPQPDGWHHVQRGGWCHVRLPQVAPATQGCTGSQGGWGWVVFEVWGLGWVVYEVWGFGVVLGVCCVVFHGVVWAWLMIFCFWVAMAGVVGVFLAVWGLCGC